MTFSMNIDFFKIVSCGALKIEFRAASDKN